MGVLIAKILKLMARIDILVRIARQVCYFEARHKRYTGHGFIPSSEANLKDIKRILDDGGVRFWLALGTFLEAVGEGRIIPHDNDTDLAIIDEDIPKLLDCVPALVEIGFMLILEKDIEGYKCGLYRYGERTGFAVFSRKKDKLVWRSIEYDSKDFNGNRIEFLGRDFNILSNPEKWLEYTYGDDWQTPIKNKGVGRGIPYGKSVEIPSATTIHK